jgi:hypothetical protein
MDAENYVCGTVSNADVYGRCEFLVAESGRPVIRINPIIRREIIFFLLFFPNGGIVTIYSSEDAKINEWFAN